MPVIVGALALRAAATTVTSGVGVSVKFQAGTTLGWMGSAPVGVVGVLDAHPWDADADYGVKGLGAPFWFGLGLGPDVHGTIGTVAGFSTITAPGVLLQDYFTLVAAATIPGPADFFAPVRTFGFVTDPTAAGPGITPFSGSFTMDVYLGAGSAFDGIPGPGATEMSTILADARVVPGSAPDPDEFRLPIAGAIDLYRMEITDAPEGILTDLILGASNEYFTVEYFADPVGRDALDPALVGSRVASAFSGTYGGSHVLGDTYLFSIDVTLASEEMIYTFGPSNGAMAPDSELPEPATLCLFALGAVAVGRRRLAHASCVNLEQR